MLFCRGLIINIAKIKILKKIGIIIFPIIVLIIICLFISVVIYTTKTVKITDANEYLKTVEYISEFIVFPETIKDIKKADAFDILKSQTLNFKDDVRPYMWVNELDLKKVRKV